MKDAPVRLFPIIIVQDRYDGAYSGGKWIALANADNHSVTASDANALMDGAWEGDVECEQFWSGARKRFGANIAFGNTPEEALSRLIEQRDMLA